MYCKIYVRNCKLKNVDINFFFHLKAPHMQGRPDSKHQQFRHALYPLPFLEVGSREFHREWFFEN